MKGLLHHRKIVSAVTWIYALFIVTAIGAELPLECLSALGMQSGSIKSWQLGGSKAPDGATVDSARYGCCTDDKDGGFCPEDNGKPFFDVNFEYLTVVTAILLQAPTNRSSYVRSYTVQFVPFGEIDLKHVLDGTEVKDFQGIKSDDDQEFKTVLQTPLITKHIRLIFDDYSNRACFRVEFFGCQSSELCSKACVNGGVCVDEELCDCVPGFTGAQCQNTGLDIDPETCNEALGLASGTIKSSQLSAKTTSASSGVDQARADCCTDREFGAWCPDPDGKSVGQWFQVQFDKPMALTRIKIQAPVRGPEYAGPINFLKSYSVQYIPEGGASVDMVDYTNDGNKVVLSAINGSREVISDLPVPVYTRSIRLVVVSYEGHPCFRFELYGCDPNEPPEESLVVVNLDTTLVAGEYTFIAINDPEFISVGNYRDAALSLNGSQYLLLEYTSTSSRKSCTLDLGQCSNGITVFVRLRLSVIYDNSYLFSNGGYCSGSDGISVIYRFGLLHAFVRLEGKFWFASYRPENILNVWTSMYVSWHRENGLRFYVNDRLVSIAKVAVTEVRKTKVDSVFFIGGYDGVDSPYTVALVNKFTVWTVYIVQLIEEHIIEIEESGKPTPTTETCPAGCKPIGFESVNSTSYPIMEGQPELTTEVTGPNGQFAFVCNLPTVADDNVEFSVAWVSGEKVLDVKDVDGTSERVVKLNLMDMSENEAAKVQAAGCRIACRVQVRFAGECGGQWSPELTSNEFLPKMELVTKSLTLVEGEPGKEVVVSLNAPPFCFCRDAKDGLNLTAKLEVQRRELHYQNGTVVSQVVLKGHMYGNVLTSRIVVSDVTWHGAQTFIVKATLDGRRDGTQTRNINVYWSCKDGVWTKLGTVLVTVHDGDHSGLCSSYNDPHIRTFDGRCYDNFYAGEFVFYKHKTKPYQVNALFSKCSPRSTGTCNCAVAVKSGDDVIVFNKCKRRGSISSQRWVPFQIYLAINGKLTAGTEIRRIGAGYTHEVILPNGGIVTVINTDMFLNVFYKPALADYNNTEGLCGTFDSNVNNDLTKRDGTIIPHSGLRPDDFNQDWRATEAEELFCGVRPIESDKSDGSVYCRVLEGDEEACGDGYDRIIQTSSNSGIDVTSLYLNDFAYRARPKNDRVVIRVKRSDEPNNADDPYAPFDIDTTHQPSEVLWPTASGRTEQDAMEHCSAVIETNGGAENCAKLLNRNFTEDIAACVYDIGATDDTQWAEETLRSIVKECTTMLNSVDNSADENGAPAPLPGGVTEEEILNSICPNNCSNQGLCNGGRCDCSAGYTGDHCSMKTSDPPLVAHLSGDGLCDRRYKKCPYAVVFGDKFQDTPKLTCHIQRYQLGEKAPPLELDEKVVAVYTKFDQIACPLPSTAPYLVRISNDQFNPSPQRLLFLQYDSVCHECIMNATAITKTTCTRKKNSCFINGGCYAKDDINPSDPCQVCDTEFSSTAWTKVYGGDCRHFVATALNYTDMVIVIVVSVVVLGVLIFTIIYVYNRRTHKDANNVKLYGPTDDVPVDVHKSTTFTTSEYDNAAFSSEFDAHRL